MITQFVVTNQNCITAIRITQLLLANYPFLGTGILDFSAPYTLFATLGLPDPGLLLWALAGYSYIGGEEAIIAPLTKSVSSRVPRVLPVALVLSVLAIAAAAPVALAARETELYPMEGEIDSWLYVDGTGFPPSDFAPGSEDYSMVDIYFSRQEAELDDEIGSEMTIYERVKSGLLVDEHGEFSTRFLIPDELADGREEEDVHRGTHYVYVTRAGESRIEGVAECTVIACEIELDLADGPVGTNVDITGADFAPADEITIEYDGGDIAVLGGPEKTDRDGEFKCSILIPESPAGKHTIAATDQSGNESDLPFTVTPKIAIVAVKGTCADVMTVAGTGFGSRSDVAITFDGDETAATEADKYGGFEVSFPVPMRSAGTYEIQARDGDKNKDTAAFLIACSIKLSHAAGNVGSEVTVAGSGFQADASITVTYTLERVTVATTASNANGEFSVTCVIPAGRHGEHPITATDDTNTATATFAVESTPPPIPSLLTPETEARARSRAYFDWEAVTDPSGVTYTLQIASHDQFSHNSIVLEKVGLSASEYLLTEEEKLESTKKEAPYYWRVKAVDGAGNETTSAVDSFDVGLSFSKLPAWAQVLIVSSIVLPLGYTCFRMWKRWSYR